MMRIKSMFKQIVVVLMVFSFVLTVDVSASTFEEILLFDYDEKVFTLYTFLNYTGFDDNNGMPFSSVRAAIRKDLESLNIDIMDKNFYHNNHQYRGNYDYPIMLMGGPPNFQYNHYRHLVPDELLYRYGILNEFEAMNLGQHLAEFYQKANINELYEKYRPHHEKEIDRVKSKAYEALAFTFDTFNLNTSDIQGQIIVDMSMVFLMEAGRGEIRTDFPDFSRGGSNVMAYGLNDNNMTDGALFAHEVLHLFVDPILAKHRDKVTEFIVYNDIFSHYTGGYDLYSYVNETFIRAIEGAYRGYYANYDSIPFPLSGKIYDFYVAYHNPETDNLEDFLLAGLSYFSGKSDDQNLKDSEADGD